METKEETKKTSTEMVVRPVATDSKTITVVVLDDKSNPSEGANVSIKPSDASDVTNNKGEVQFKLGSATKYDITASYGNSTVTVPYYVTKDGATRLVVNPTYVRSVEKKLNPQFWSEPSFIKNAAIGLGVLVLFIIIWKVISRKK